MGVPGQTALPQFCEGSGSGVPCGRKAPFPEAPANCAPVSRGPRGLGTALALTVPGTASLSPEVLATGAAFQQVSFSEWVGHLPAGSRDAAPHALPPAPQHFMVLSLPPDYRWDN